MRRGSCADNWAVHQGGDHIDDAANGVANPLAMRSPAVVLCVGLIAACACSGTGDLPASWTDTLVLNPAPSSSTPVWRLSTEPMLTIGQEGDSLYEFNSPQVALTLSDGRIVVTNAYSELRYYDATGRHQLTAGRKGPGPGEFSMLLGITRLDADSVAALDAGAERRLLVFSSRGGFVRSQEVQFTGFDSYRLSDGQWIGVPAGRHGTRVECPSVPTRLRREVEVVRFSAGGRARATLARVPGVLSVAYGCSFASVPFGPYGSFTVGGGWLFTTAGHEHVIERRSLDNGAVVQVVRTALRPRPLEPYMLHDLEEADAEKLRRSNVRREARSDVCERALTPPSVLPAIASMRVDPEGNLWVRRYFVVRDAQHEWWIYDPTGRLRARLFTPRALRLTEIGVDYVLGIWRDDLDVETVRRYGLIRQD